MAISDEARLKLDATLLALLDKRPDEMARAVVRLNSLERSKKAEPNPRDFKDRRAYRAAVIAKAREKTSDADMEFKQRADELDLTIKGTGLLRRFVIEGKVGAIAELAEEASVLAAEADFELELDLE